MTTESIPMGEAVNWGWNKFKENAVFLVVVQIVALMLPAFVEHFGKAMARNSFMESIIGLVVFIVTTTLELGLVKIALRILDGKPVEFANLFDSFDLVPWYAVVRFLMIVACLIGLFLLIVPGIMLLLRLWFIAYVTYDERPKGVDALQRSIDITRGFTFDLFLFLLLLIGVNILGALCLGVGLFVSLPVSVLATAYVFRHLKAYSDARSAPATAPATPSTPSS
jgi:uncharacterized membrane protein